MTGLKWFGSLGWKLFGTRTTYVFHMSETLSSLRLRLNRYVITSHSWSANSLSSLELKLSGLVAFLIFIFLNPLLTWSTNRESAVKGWESMSVSWRELSDIMGGGAEKPPWMVWCSPHRRGYSLLCSGTQCPCPPQATYRVWVSLW